MATTIDAAAKNHKDVLINGQLYDVTDFRHPGKFDAIPSFHVPARWLSNANSIVFACLL